MNRGPQCKNNRGELEVLSELLAGYQHDQLPFVAAFRQFESPTAAGAHEMNFLI